MNKEDTQGRLLIWKQQTPHYQEAQLGTHEDGVLFSLVRQPTCRRRGPWRLLIEVCYGRNHHAWGCFDDQDQPMRYYHKEKNAKDEAEAIAEVLHRDRWGDELSKLLQIEKTSSD